MRASRIVRNIPKRTNNKSKHRRRRGSILWIIHRSRKVLVEGTSRPATCKWSDKFCMDSPPILPVTSIWHSFVASFCPLDDLIVSRHTIDSCSSLFLNTHFSRQLKTTRNKFIFVIIFRFNRTDDESKIMFNSVAKQVGLKLNFG